MYARMYVCMCVHMYVGTYMHTLHGIGGFCAFPVATVLPIRTSMFRNTLSHPQYRSASPHVVSARVCSSSAAEAACRRLDPCVPPLVSSELALNLGCR